MQTTQLVFGVGRILIDHSILVGYVLKWLGGSYLGK